MKQACKVLLIALLSEREGEGGQRRDNVKEAVGRGLRGEGGREIKRQRALQSTDYCFVTEMGERGEAVKKKAANRLRSGRQGSIQGSAPLD